MKLRLLVPLCLFALSPCLGESIKQAEAAIAAAHSAGNFDGVVVISQNGKPVSVTALGFSDRARKIPIRPDTVFRLASLTKQVTALLIMRQVEAGKLQLDAKAGGYLKSLPPSSARVTVRQLLQHVSGLPNPSDGPDNIVPPFYLRQDPGAADPTKNALGFCSGTPKRDPGAQFEYNNCDYIVLGALLESVTGKPYARLLADQVIKPLGLTSWGLFPADPKGAVSVALSYQEDGTVDLPQNPATYGPAGALYGNALDLAKWNEALLSHRLLSASATDTMFRAAPKLYGEALGSWAYDLPLAAPPVHIVERQGDIGGTRLLTLLLPNQNASVGIISNTARADLFNTYSKQGLGFAIVKAWLQ